MSTIAIPRDSRAPRRLLIAALGSCISLVVLATGENLPRLSEPEGPALRTEMLNNADAWRIPEQDDHQWRTSPPRQSGRFTLGFDSVYEEAQQRREEPTEGVGWRNPKPSSILRFDF